MADRKKSKDGEKETEKVISAMNQPGGVPGAFGKGKDRDLGQTGVSHVRQKTDEIAPTEGTDND